MNEKSNVPMPAPHIPKSHIDELMKRVTYVTGVPEGTTSTFCHAYLEGKDGNKFYLATGHSACVSPANFNAQKGREIAEGKAEVAAQQELWKLEGYALFRGLNDLPALPGGAA